MSSPSDLKSIGLKATLPRLKILDLFEQSDKRHMTAEEVYRLLSDEGQDIGLATVYRVVESNGGVLRVESRIGQGTSFRVRLPAAEVPE